MTWRRLDWFTYRAQHGYPWRESLQLRPDQVALILGSYRGSATRTNSPTVADEWSADTQPVWGDS